MLQIVVRIAKRFIFLVLLTGMSLVLFIEVTVLTSVFIADWNKYGVKTGLWFSDYKSEYTNGVWGDFTEYSEYHFNKETIKKFEKSKWYSIVTDADIENIKEYFRNFRVVLNNVIMLMNIRLI